MITNMLVKDVPPALHEYFINVYFVGLPTLPQVQGHWHLTRHEAVMSAYYVSRDYGWKTAYRIRIKMKGTKS